MNDLTAMGFTTTAAKTSSHSSQVAGASHNSFKAVSNYSGSGKGAFGGFGGTNDKSKNGKASANLARKSAIAQSTTGSQVFHPKAIIESCKVNSNSLIEDNLKKGILPNDSDQ